jgi:hypothetical protein
MGCFLALNKGLAEWMVLAIPSAAGTGPLNTTGMVTTRDAAVNPEAWIRFETRERGYETGEREYESGIDGESRGAPRDSWSLPKTPRRHPSNVSPPPPTDHNRPPW